MIRVHKSDSDSAGSCMACDDRLSRVYVITLSRPNSNASLEYRLCVDCGRELVALLKRGGGSRAGRGDSDAGEGVASSK